MFRWYIIYHIISYHIISYHNISYHIISYHIISYHIIWCEMIWYLMIYGYELWRLINCFNWYRISKQISHYHTHYDLMLFGWHSKLGSCCIIQILRNGRRLGYRDFRSINPVTYNCVLLPFNDTVGIHESPAQSLLLALWFSWFIAIINVFPHLKAYVHKSPPRFSVRSRGVSRRWDWV